MKKKYKLPTILGLLILIVSVVSGVMLINSKTIFKIGASTSSDPKNVRISNITDSQVTISWTTDGESLGFIKWGKTENSISTVVSEKINAKGFVHTATITNINPLTSVFIKINSGGKDYDNNGLSWQAKTIDTKQSSTQNLIASGIILSSDETTPANAIVYININGVLLSDTTSSEGSYLIPISNYIQNVSDTTVIEISAIGKFDETAQSQIYSTNVNSIPVMILGKTYDFRSLTKSDNSTSPQSSFSIPASIEVSSRFEVTKNNATPAGSKGTVSLESINEGETIMTTDPEFFGKAPSKSKLEILVESELQTATVTADTKGSWSWSPPKNLEPGEHKVTLKWTDASGIVRTLTRTFIVQASEGPAFESTPSASLKPSPTATATIKASTPSATQQPTPETGSLTPTVGLFIMGMGILLLSIYFNKTYA